MAERLPARRTPGRSRLQRRVRALLWLLAVLLALAVVAGAALMLGARGPLLDARNAAQVGRSALVAGDGAGAARAFARAEASFQEAGGRLANPFTRLASMVPVVGRTPDAVAAVASAGELTAQAGELLAQAIQDLDGGAALVPRGGVIPIEPLQRAGPSLRRARDLLTRADAIADTETFLVPGPVRRPLEIFQAEVGDARRAVISAEAMARALPAFLGADGPRRYFLGAQNTAELRGTGGLIGSFTVLTTDGGRIEFDDFRALADLPPTDPTRFQAPNPDYDLLYGQEAAEHFGLLNSSPDVPSSAVAIERGYEQLTGTVLDGTILADPQAFALLLRATGPAEVPGTDLTVDAESVVSFVTNEAYSLLPDSRDRKRILGDVAEGVIRRFLFPEAGLDPQAAGLSLVEAAAGGHMVFHTTNPEVQASFRQAGVSGELVDADLDYLAVVANDTTGNKIDFYAQRHLRYRVELRSGGAANGRLQVDVANDAPTEGQPPYVIGPYAGTGLRAGDNRMIVGTYCADGCALRGYTVDGAIEEVVRAEELGHPLTLSEVTIPAGESRRLEYGWTLPRAWEGGDTEGVYRLTVQSQPTIRPTELEVEILVPPGMRVARTTPGMEITAEGATWRGPVEDLLTLEVEFERPLLGRLARAAFGLRPLAADR